MIDDYTRIKDSLWNPHFRKQRLLNLVNNRAWHAGFDRILCSLPYEQSVDNDAFRHDARESFRQEIELIQEEENMIVGDDIPSVGADRELNHTAQISCEALVYRVISVYVQRRLKSKYQLEWSTVKDDANKRKEYLDAKEKITRDAFLAVRSRNGIDFIDYFASTLCSVSQPLNEQQYVNLAQVLYNDTDKVRTLTMLALSAR
jgi:CRISPR-associated protein Cmx8